MSIERLRVLRRVAGVASVRLPTSLPRACTDADVVVLWTIALAPYLPLLRLTRRPVICSVHEILPNMSGRLLAAVTCTLSDILMVNSHATGQWLTQNRQRHPYQLAYPIAPVFAPLASESRESSSLRLLVVGRVNGHKGHLEAVLAARAAHQVGVQVELTLLGGPFPGQEGHLATLLTAIADLPWAHYRGEVADVQSFLRQCDVVLIPSTRPEPFGLVALEAWAAGRPVVGSEAGGLTEAVEMVNGVLVPPADVSRLRDAIVRAARDPAFLAAPRGDAPARELCSVGARERAWESCLNSAHLARTIKSR